MMASRRSSALALLAFEDWRGQVLRVACLVGVLATSLGVCAVYVVFISTQVLAMLEAARSTFVSHVQSA